MATDLTFLPLSEDQALVLEVLHDRATLDWASKQLTGRLRNLGLIERRAGSETEWALTELGRAVVEASMAHQLRLGRKPLGGGAIFGSGMRYGVSARCSCLDWAASSNEARNAGGEREMRRQHAAHLRAVLA